MSIIKKTLERLISDKQQKLLELDPDRFFVENIRSFYNLTTPVAKFLCELAVKQGLFTKKFGLMCPNDGCDCMIKSYAPGETIDNSLTCENCLIRGIVPHTFPSDSLERMPYYQLRTKVGTGLTGKIQLVKLEETGEKKLIEPKEARETVLDEIEESREMVLDEIEEARKMETSELNESGKTKHDKLKEMRQRLDIYNAILNMFWKSMFSLAVLVAFVIVLVFLFRAKTLEYRVPLAVVEAVLTGTMFPVFNHFFPVKRYTNKS